VSSKRDRPRFPTTPLRVLHVAMELAPWASVGDVGAWLDGLTRAQQAAGDRVTVVLPEHGIGTWRRRNVQKVVGSQAKLQLGDRLIDFSLARLKADQREIILVRSELFERGGIYSNPDTGALYADTLLRASVLCHAALYWALNAGGRWQVIHGHDHHGALACALLRRRFQPTPLQHARSVLTVHDASFWGLHDLEEVPLSGLPPSEAQPGGPFAVAGMFSALRAGLVLADRVHLVAPRQATEVLDADGVAGPLTADFQARAEQTLAVSGGVEAAIDPSNDPRIASAFSWRQPSGRAECRDDLLGLSGLPGEVGGTPVVIAGYAGPLLPEKGLDVLAAALPHLPPHVVVAVVGAGHPETVAALQDAAQRHPGRLWFHHSSASEPAIQLLAGTDLFVLPGRHAPGDLRVLEASRYGALPVTSRAGGPASLIDGQPGWAYDGDPEDPEALAAALTTAAAEVASPDHPARVRAALKGVRTWGSVAAALRREAYLGG
jgi:starch synthase